MKCNHCGETIPDDARFCPECGTMCAVQMRCNQCGQVSEPLNGRSVRFCPFCGSADLTALPFSEDKVPVGHEETPEKPQIFNAEPVPEYPESREVRYQAGNLDRLQQGEVSAAPCPEKKGGSGCKKVFKVLLTIVLVFIGLCVLLAGYVFWQGKQRSEARHTETAAAGFSITKTWHAEGRPTQTPTLTSTPRVRKTEVPTATFAPAERSRSGVDPDLKAFLDEYESFMDGYVNFMKSYSSSGDPMAMLTQYMSWLSQYESFSEKAERYDSNSSDMSAADLSYYMEVMGRINQKLLSAY